MFVKGEIIVYLTSSKTGNNTYFYLREYTKKQKMTSRKEKDLYSLGRLDKALDKVEMWLVYPGTLPKELRELGVTTEIVKGWKKKILENKQIFSKKCTHNNKKVI